MSDNYFYDTELKKIMVFKEDGQYILGIQDIEYDAQYAYMNLEQLKQLQSLINNLIAEEEKSV